MSEISKEDLEAALALRMEQGSSVDPALVDSLASRIEQVVRERAETEVVNLRRQVNADRFARLGQLIVACASLLLGLPITAILSENPGLSGVIVAWVGIVLVNIAFALGARKK
ncbi:hypothetical protein [Tessaracoccus sp. OH4464_COT-324]|uniref:hypothetical protein n=1 Tax=Tessaracoccus sp. OH4464_COT-324 TaxID=2491059 RepID=UPI000F635111|nr:hypothetical protein [Tessaracoccus sp. OH4464_COT-324]RRD46113.1 hypothetical protein EII42_08600 [Tessaracoccus sp. OH4464_COT-324]